LRIPTLTALAAIALLALSACSASSGDPAAPTSSTARVVTVAVENNSKPLSYTDTSGKLTGYEVELLRAVDERLPEYSFEIESSSSEDANLVGLDTGKFALVGGGYYRTAAREAKYLYGQQNVGVSAILIWKRAGDTSINTIDDLATKKLAPVTPNGGIYNLLVDYTNAHPNAPINIPVAENVSMAERVKGVASGQYDALVIPNNLDVASIAKELQLDVTRADDPIEVRPTYVLFNKAETEVAGAVDQALIELKADGTLSKLSEQFFNEDVFTYTITKP